MANPILIVENLSKVYSRYLFLKRKRKEFHALKGISFSLHEGEILGLLGPNGAGKTTTIQILLSVLTPTSGKIRIFDKDFFSHRSDIMQNITFASSYINMPSNLTVLENLLIYGRLYSLKKSEILSRLEKFLKFFKIWDQKDKEINSLSSGQMTRVMLTKAFLPHPKIVLLDEPTASLDPDIADDVIKFIKKQKNEHKTSIIFTSHKMPEVAKICDRIIFLQNGRITACDTPDNLVSTISKTTLFLIFDDADIQRKAKDFLKEHNIDAQEEKNGNTLVFFIDENSIGTLLQQLGKNDLKYKKIKIESPTLDDYFKIAAKMQKEEMTYEF